MIQSQQTIASEAGGLARVLPNALLLMVSDQVEACDWSNWSVAQGGVTGNIAHAHYRNLVQGFLECWRQHAPQISSQAVAMALRTATHCEKTHQDRQAVELVWTGPEAGVVPFRRTEQALLQVIDSALRRVLVVSYAVYRIPRVCEALVRAASRGVGITLIVETPDRLEGQNTYSTLEALGPEVAAKSSVYLWPLEQRTKDENGRPGILHVKCAVADGRCLFLTSANLTEYAFTTNMELGLLVTGGSLPEQIERHFERMVQLGLLARP